MLSRHRSSLGCGVGGHVRACFGGAGFPAFVLALLLRKGDSGSLSLTGGLLLHFGNGEEVQLAISLPVTPLKSSGCDVATNRIPRFNQSHNVLIPSCRLRLIRSRRKTTMVLILPANTSACNRRKAGGQDGPPLSLSMYHRTSAWPLPSSQRRNLGPLRPFILPHGRTSNVTADHVSLFWL